MNGYEVTTRNDEIRVTIPIGFIHHDPVSNLKSRPGSVVRRWFHSLTDRNEQKSGFGYMKKTEALRAAVERAREQGKLL